MKPTLRLKTRREFLRTTMLGAASCWTVPAFIQQTFFSMNARAADSAVQVATGRDHPILVVVQLAGGNDGLNTLIPYADDLYYQARPRLGIAANEVLKLNDHLGLHPALGDLQQLFGSGELAIVQGVGYPNPNRSHFRSTEIWETASESNQSLNSGWLGRYFDNACDGADPTAGVTVGGQLPQSFIGSKPVGMVVPSMAGNRLRRQNASDTTMMDSAGMDDSDSGINMEGSSILSVTNSTATGGNPLDFLERTALNAEAGGAKIDSAIKQFQPGAEWPANRLAQQLRTVAAMIGGGLDTRVYYTTLGGFDTHNNQLGTHQRLLGELGTSLAAFDREMKHQGNHDRVMVMSFSEFGRRVAENGSAGTDHGAAAPLILTGGKLKAGLLGKTPSLSSLNRGDIQHSVDFRSLYATVLEDWLGTPSAPILSKAFPKLPLFT